MIFKDWKKEIFTIPNLLSVFRLLLIPVYITIYLNATTAEGRYLAGGILAISCLTDAIDGKIARHYNMVSTLGKLLDPIADKATQFSLIACLMIRYPVLRYLIIPFVIKECFQFTACLVNFKQGRVLKNALLSGKICTTVLFLSLIALMVAPQLSDTAVNILAAVDGGFMLVALGNYMYVFLRKRDKTEKFTPVENKK